jgi:hypothetical protein
MNLNIISKICDECDGTGCVSRCCDAPVYDYQCSFCFRFAKKDICHNCGGEGRIKFSVGDKIILFICMYSPEDLKEKFYMSKKMGDVKTFKGKIIEIVDEFNVLAKINYKGVHVLNIEHIDAV